MMEERNVRPSVLRGWSCHAEPASKRNSNMRMSALLTTASVAWVGAALLVAAFAGSPDVPNSTETNAPKQVMPQTQDSDDDSKLRKATFASGCFWCTEAVFDQLKGVKSVESGYTGGLVVDPTYEQVCSGTTGHAEAIQITYDPAEISFEDLLRVFWQTHDPTTLNRQGHDVGTQYRSGIFYHDDEQRAVAEQYKRQLDSTKSFGSPIVTKITAFERFYPAEKYHQEYFERNPNQGYCAMVIRPKVDKFQKEFKDLLREDGK
jgi:methionine-S-sulfoxide reductase